MWKKFALELGIQILHANIQKPEDKSHKKSALSTHFPESISL